MPRRSREVGLPFDIVEGRLSRLGVPAAALREIRDEWESHSNEDRGWFADEMSKRTDDEIRLAFAENRARGADAG